jgi:signal transduction histidine kinase
MRQIARQFEIRLEERVSERTRIARELHDTLLQSLQGLILRFQTAYDFLPGRPIQAKHALEAALDRADRAIAEGRDAVHDLRSRMPTRIDFAEMVTAMIAEMTSDESKRDISFDTVVEGKPQTLQAILQDEICAIVREALRNAISHSEARNIETEIAYGERLFRVRIRDDGKGINPRVLEQGGRVGHWGLPGMRERAARIGAQLEFWSEVGAGTEIQLSVSASVAYGKSIAHFRFPLFQRKMEASDEHRS